MLRLKPFYFYQKLENTELTRFKQYKPNIDQRIAKDINKYSEAKLIISLLHLYKSLLLLLYLA